MNYFIIKKLEIEFNLLIFKNDFASDRYTATIYYRNTGTD